jgi:hypothetical protein
MELGIKNGSNFRGRLYSIIFWLYLIISQGVAVFYFIQIVKGESSWVKLIFIDPLMAEIKGILWPVFLWSDHIIG